MEDEKKNGFWDSYWHYEQLNRKIENVSDLLIASAVLIAVLVFAYLLISNHLIWQHYVETCILLAKTAQEISMCN